MQKDKTNPKFGKPQLPNSWIKKNCNSKQNRKFPGVEESNLI